MTLTSLVCLFETASAQEQIAMDYGAWCCQSDEELAQQDIGFINLVAARGLPGSERLNVDECLKRLDDWAGIAEEATNRWWPKFRSKPHEYENSEGQFRMMALVTVLQRDLGSYYNPACITGPDDATDSIRPGSKKDQRIGRNGRQFGRRRSSIFG